MGILTVKHDDRPRWQMMDVLRYPSGATLFIVVVDGGVAPLGGNGRKIDGAGRTGCIGIVSMLPNAYTAVGDKTQDGGNRFLLG